MCTVNGMAHVLDVARCILERQGPVTGWKLEKLVYYVQAWAIAKGDPLFNDTIKAWVQGPVVPALFHAHKNRRVVKAEDLTGHGRGLTDQELAHIDSVLAHYGRLPAGYLSKMTHFERPWSEARGLGEREGSSSPAITIESIRAFYSGRTPEDLEADFQMSLARSVMKKYEKTLARLAL
jgi:uncharacterized phage-associated protein